MTREQQVIWAAGWFEGEGSISTYERVNVTLVASSTDHDVIQRFASVWGSGRVGGPFRRGTNKPFWRWHVCGDRAAEIAEEMLPFLGERRTEKALEAIAAREERRKAATAPCLGCGNPVGGVRPRRWCSGTCRKRTSRALKVTA